MNWPFFGAQLEIDEIESPRQNLKCIMDAVADRDTMQKIVSNFEARGGGGRSRSFVYAERTNRYNTTNRRKRGGAGEQDDDTTETYEQLNTGITKSITDLGNSALARKNIEKHIREQKNNWLVGDLLGIVNRENEITISTPFLKLMCAFITELIRLVSSYGIDNDKMPSIIVKYKDHIKNGLSVLGKNVIHAVLNELMIDPSDKVLSAQNSADLLQALNGVILEVMRSAFFEPNIEQPLDAVLEAVAREIASSQEVQIVAKLREIVDNVSKTEDDISSELFEGINVEEAKNEAKRETGVSF
jgi:hypothetical protein